MIEVPTSVENVLVLSLQKYTLKVISSCVSLPVLDQSYFSVFDLLTFDSFKSASSFRFTNANLSTDHQSFILMSI